MKSKNKIYALLSCCLLLIIGVFWSFGVKDKSPFEIAGHNYVPEFVSKSVNYLNEMPQFRGSHYKVYTAGFRNRELLPQVFFEKEKAVLWLGSRQLYNMHGLNGFYKIFVSSPLLERAYKEQGIDNIYYMPTGIVAEEGKYLLSQDNKANKDFVIIGNPPYFEELLLDRNETYKKYTWKDIENETEVLKNARAVVVDNPLKDDVNDLDVPYLLLAAALKKIPIIGHWEKENHYNMVYIFNDYANFYMYRDDAKQLLDEILQFTDVVEKRVKKNRDFVLKYFSSQKVAEQIAAVISKTKRYDEVKKGQITISIPTGVGHYGAGDYWLAKDIEKILGADGNYEFDYAFQNSYYDLPADVYIRLRGSVFHKDVKKFGRLNIFYLIYPGGPLRAEQEYFKELIRGMQGSDIFISASKSVADKMQKLGYKSYYLPQFTDTEKFYYDYNEKLKSKVLFVGNFHFKRTGIMWALEKKLPLTIYGDKFPEGMARAKYIDNRILRQYYSSAKIVLNDTLPAMRAYGFISNRIFDATASGAFVISDYMPEIEEIYGDSVPMYKNAEELKEIVHYYLTHDEERQRLAKKAHDITINNFTLRPAMKRLSQIIKTEQAHLK